MSRSHVRSQRPPRDDRRPRSTGRRRPVIAVAAVAALLAPLTACGGKGAGYAAGAGKGGTLGIALTSDVLTLDPAMYRDRVTQSVVRNVFDALVDQGPDLSFQPELATSWKQQDATTWTFQLRKGVKFQDGEPFNADAVKFSIERVLNPAQKSPRSSMLDAIETVRAVDPYTVEIKTRQPYPLLLAELSVNEIVPPKYVAKVGDAVFGKKPVGTGPFSFVEWVPNERVVLKANKDYWGGKPKVDKLVFRPIPEVSARIAALRSGDVQIASAVPADLAKTLSGGVKSATVTGTRIYFLAMNVTKAPFTSRDARVGVNYAIDRGSLVSGLYQGFGRPLYQPAFPEMLGYDTTYQGYRYDQGKARQMLAAAKGTTVRIDAEEDDKTLAEAVAGQLSAAGIKASVNVLEAQAFTDATESGKSQAYLSSWGVAEGDADVIFARHFWSPSRKDAFYTGYRNAALDKLIAEARSTADHARRVSLYQQATEMVMHDAPWAPLLNPQEIYGVSAKLANWQPSPIGRFNVAKSSLS